LDREHVLRRRGRPQGLLAAALASIGVLRESASGREKVFLNSRLLTLLTREGNAFEPYR
jgi:hypothetical protein